jgi:uncharacterized membrane-anchored protein
VGEKLVSRTANTEERRENGLSLIVIGFLLWFFDALVFFFMPAGVRLGEQRPFALLVASAFIAGAIVMGIGFYVRREKEKIVR